MKSSALQPSGLSPEQFESTLTFDAYVDATRARIAQARVDLDGPDREKIIAANTPQQFDPATGRATLGVILVHGLLDSPGPMQSLFETFKQDNAAVRSILLPGHGTRPGDLLTVHRQQWLDRVAYAVNELRPRVDKLIVCGYSTGAALAVISAYNQLPIDGLVLLAPCFEIKNPLAITAGWLSALSRYWAKLAWFQKGPETDYTKYQSIAYNGIHQVYRLTQTLKAKAQQATLKTPICLVTTSSDEIVKTDKAEAFFKAHANTQSRMLCYGECQLSEDPRVTTRPNVYPEEKIVSFSHVCLAVAPDHPHYGRTGDYQDFVHYDLWWGKLFKREKSPIYQGAITHTTLYHHTMQRLSYNPDFAFMVTHIKKFIAAI